MVGSIAATTAPSIIVQSLAGLYGIARDFNDYINEHLREMQESENATISRTGKVLEAAKLGFGIGFTTPVVIIATGQMILGNPLAAGTTVLTAPMNPLAMTCAAVGAVYYGWNALSDLEKQEFIQKVSNGLEVGIELVKAVIDFSVKKVKELLTSENLAEVKRYIRQMAVTFHKKLSRITNKMVDTISDAGESIKTFAGHTINKTGDVISAAFEKLKPTQGKDNEKQIT